MPIPARRHLYIETPPCHQQQWYWLCKTGRSLCYTRKDFNHLCHVSVEGWYELWIHVYISSEMFRIFFSFHSAVLAIWWWSSHSVIKVIKSFDIDIYPSCVLAFHIESSVSNYRKIKQLSNRCWMNANFNAFVTDIFISTLKLLLLFRFLLLIQARW